MLTTIPLGIIDSAGNSKYATWSTTNKSSNITISGTNNLSNLVFRGGSISSKLGTGIATIGKSSGKWYWEVTLNNTTGVASLGGLVGACNWIPNSANISNVWGFAQGMGFGSVSGFLFGLSYNLTGTVVNAAPGTAALINNDVVSFALDLDSAVKNIKMYKNGIQVGPTLTGITGTWYPACMSQGTGVTRGGTANFGQNPWSTNLTVTSTRNALFLAGYNQGVYNI